MNTSRRHASAVLAALVSLAPFVLAGAAPAAAQVTDSARIAELERRMEALTREIERLSLGGDVVVADTSVGGLGYGASKVYSIDQGVSIGGYGELLYENFGTEREDGALSGASDRFDALRAILYVGYKFNDRLLFNSEIEIEHADEAYLEFAYVDYLLSDDVGLRGGLLLAPLGLVNELHEAPTYLGTERPVTENRIIPTTWRENGLGLFGSAGDFDWRAYVLTSLDGTGFDASGLRGGRQKGSKALAENLGFAGRLDYTGRPGLLLGASAYHGKTGQSNELNGSEVDGDLFIWDLHADWKIRGWELRGMVAGVTLDDAAELNDLNGLVGDQGVGERMLGWYLQAGYDILRSTDSSHQLIPYLRHERVDTQRRVPTGFSADPANALSVTSFGVSWKPAPQVVWKAGYQFHSNDADTGVNQWNLQIGWLF